METDFYDYTMQELSEEKDRCFLTGRWCPNQLCEQCQDYLDWERWCQENGC